MTSEEPQQEEPLRRGPSTRDRVLVALIIVGVLAVLSPAYFELRRKAHNASCLSNLRHIGEAMNLYMQDNEGRLPPAGYTIPNDSRMITWAVLMGAYMAPTHLTCPADIDHKGPPWLDPDAPEARRIHVSYGMFVPAATQKRDTLQYNGAMLALIADSSAAGLNRVPMPGVPAPQQPLFLGFDTKDNITPKGAQVVQRLAVFSSTGDFARLDEMTARHGNTINMLFADGHIASVPTSVIAVMTNDRSGQPAEPWGVRHQDHLAE